MVLLQFITGNIRNSILFTRPTKKIAALTFDDVIYKGFHDCYL